MAKTALVTGSSSGIGYETALALARGGYETFASMRNTDAGEKLKKAAADEDIPVRTARIDVDNQDSVNETINRIISETGRIDVLVNNAGYGQFGCAEDVTLDEFRAQFETNFFSIVRMIQAVAPVMRDAGSGTIVNISSVVGRMGLPGSAAYISAKFALEGLSECLRYELGQFGIRTTLVEPGVIKTRFFDSMKIPQSSVHEKYKQLSDGILANLKIMVDMGTEPAQVAETIMKAITDDEILPRYTAGADAAMFMEAKRMKTDIEFEKYISEEIFSK